MTTIRIDNGNTSQTNDFYLELHASNVKSIWDKKTKTFPIPKPENKWNQGPKTILIDLLEITRKFIVTGRLDAQSNKTDSWGEADLSDAAMVLDRLRYMQESGGVVTFTRTLSSDGYGSDPTLGTGGDRTYEVDIIRLQVQEQNADDDVATSYSFIMELLVGENR